MSNCVSTVRLAIVAIILTVLLLPLGSMILFKALTGQPAVALGMPQFELNGMAEEITRPSLTYHGWLAHDFQESFSKWFSRYFGARALFVRAGNQFMYSIFGESYMYDRTIIIGKGEQLYEAGYIYEFCRLLAPMPLQQADMLIKEAAELQHRLAERNINFLLLISPSKASIYPEYVPDAYCGSPKPVKRDYENLLPLLARYRVNFVDGHAITARAKARQELPVFPRGGTHWNHLGAFPTVEALIERVCELSERRIEPGSITRIEMDETPGGTDKDLAQLLNLLVPPYDYPAPRPIFSMSSPAFDLGKLVIVGSSFNYTAIDVLAELRAFKEIDFYYYYKLELHSFPGHIVRPVNVTMLDWEHSILQAKTIVLEINETGFQRGYVTAFLTDILEYLRRMPTP